jgi:nucleotide-binding universal stress UspA family protein
MHMTAEVLVVPLDGSELADRAVPIASRLVGAVGGRLVLLAIASDARAVTMRTHLDEHAASVTDVPVDTAVLSSRDVAAAIVEVADTHDASICMTSHGRGGLRWAFLGSVAEQVVRASSRPVLLIGPRCAPGWQPGPGPVLVAHDGTQTGDTFVDTACDWALRLDTTLLLATVIHPLDAEDAARPQARLSDAEARIRARGCTVDDIVVQRHFPAGVLADLAVEHRAPVIVMGSHGRRGLERVIVGSTTMALLALASCPIIVSPPPGEAT